MPANSDITLNCSLDCVCVCVLNYCEQIVRQGIAITECDPAQGQRNLTCFELWT